MKLLMLSTAILTMTTLGAAAQDPERMFHTRDQQSSQSAIMGSDLIGMRVYRSDRPVTSDGANLSDPASDDARTAWDDIGEINDIVLTRDGSVQAVLVDIGGFLGMGERQVAVDMGALELMADTSTEDGDDFLVVLTADPDRLRDAPVYETQTDAQTGMTGGRADTQAQPARDTSPTVQEAGDEGPTGAVPPTWREGYSQAGETDLTAERLTGAEVFGPNDDSLGEVSEIVLADDGSVDAVVVDVGGFLGIGAKPVALPLSDIEILRADDGADVRVHVPLTEDELDTMPEYSS